MARWMTAGAARSVRRNLSRALSTRAFWRDMYFSRRLSAFLGGMGRGPFHDFEDPPDAAGLAGGLIHVHDAGAELRVAFGHLDAGVDAGEETADRRFLVAADD